ncbi:MAG TPA: Tol-Pal system beta propeller repeat protein TolB [Steroidobacteraceae bacterium]|nr:Tol-Pal system beta propeller repeat protein TolB [Steroidobacteraceae bacterium]
MNEAFRRLRFLLLLTAGCVSFASVANGEFVVQITRGQDNAIPIAVVPFAPPQGAAAPFDVAALVAHDLDGSGRFKTMDRKDMIDQPHTGAEIAFDDWRRLNNDYILVGRLNAVAANRYDIVFWLYNVLTRQPLLGFQISTDTAGLRLASHQLADKVFQAIVGIRGAFATRIAYVSVLGHVPRRTYQLVVADADGANPRVIMQSAQPLMSPAWSPDGTRLAYVSFEDHQPSIYVQVLKSGARRLVSDAAGVNQAPAWSPDGRKLALTLSNRAGNLDIFVLDLATKGLTRITHDPGIDTEPQWSPDGKSLYFTSDRDGGPQVFEKSLARGGRALRLTFAGSYNARPRVSPDGSQLAFVTREHGAYRIATLDLKNHNGMQVLTKGQFDVSPSYAPNGAVILYATRERGRGVLALVSTDGRVQQTLMATVGEVEEPAWGPFRSD